MYPKLKLPPPTSPLLRFPMSLNKPHDLTNVIRIRNGVANIVLPRKGTRKRTRSVHQNIRIDRSSYQIHYSSANLDVIL